MSSQSLLVSSVQRALWLHHQLAKSSSAYNLVLAIRIQSQYDSVRLAGAIDLVVARHQLLGQCFVDVAGLPGRVVAEPIALRLEVIDSSEDKLEEVVQEFIDRPFDLRRNVARFGLVRFGPTAAVLLPVVHHIASDFVSHWIIVRDIVDAYHNRPLPDQMTSFDDAVIAEQRVLASASSVESATFWTNRCAATEAVELPSDRPRSAASSGKGDCYKTRLPAGLVAQLPDRAAEFGVTPFAVLLGAFTALIHRLTSAEEVLIGCPASSRRGRRQRETVGPFINTVPIRAYFPALTTVGTAVARAHEQLVSGVVHVRYPCSALSGGVPTYRIAMLMVDARTAAFKLPAPSPGNRWGAVKQHGELSLALLDVASQGGQMDLVVRLEQGDDGVDVVCAYDTELYDVATIERLVAAYGTMLECALECPDRNVAELELTNKQDVEQLLLLGRVWSA